MICYSCDSENWRGFPELNKERLLQVCMNCGNVAYKVEPEDEAKIRDYYRKEYRGQLSHQNLLTTNRKLQNIIKFLGDHLKAKEDAGQRLTCGDVGCATGYIPAYLRNRDHKATGSEWTVTMRRFAEHYYGIPVTEELDDRHQYDLITAYHVLEHLIEPDKKLKHYASLLKDDGRMMISTPHWLDMLEEASGTQVASFEHLFHKDHINVFTKQSIRRLFAKAGLVVEKEDLITYGQTYLLRKAAPGETVDAIPLTENPEEVIDKLAKNKVAIDLFLKEKYRDAIDVWKRFPDAYINYVFNTNVKKDLGLSATVFNEGMQAIPECTKFRAAYGHWLYQQEKYDQALEHWDYVLKYKCNEDIQVFKAKALKIMGRHREAINSAEQAVRMNPQKWTEMNDLIASCCTQMPAWDEVARAKLQEELLAKSGISIMPEDPAMKDGEKVVTPA